MSNNAFTLFKDRIVLVNYEHEIKLLPKKVNYFTTLFTDLLNGDLH